MAVEFYQRYQVARRAEVQMALVRGGCIQVQHAKHRELLPNFPARHAGIEHLVQFIFIDYHGWTGCAEPAKIATYNKKSAGRPPVRLATM